MIKIILKGEKVTLEPYTLEKCHDFYKNYVSDPAMTYDTYSYDREKINKYYENKVLDKDRLFFSICEKDRVIGEIQIKKIDREKLCGTLSIVLSNDKFKGKGYGTEALKLIIDYGFNILGLKTIYADAVHRNQRSKYILEKLGFEHLYEDDILVYYRLNIG